MTFHFFNNVFGLNLTFEPTERILQGFALLQSNFCHSYPPKIGAMSILYSRFLRCQDRTLGSCNHELLADVVTRGLFRGVRFFFAEIEECRLLCGVFTQFGHLVDSACNRLHLSSLILALCFVSLSLLPRVFLLALCEC